MTRDAASKLGSKALREKYVKNVKKYNKKPNKCLSCDESFISDGIKKLSVIKKRKFCNNTCRKKYNEKFRRQKNPFANCIYCNEPLKTAHGKYCNNTCKSNYVWEQWCKEVRENGEFKGYHAHVGSSSIVKVKKFLKEYYGNKCSICEMKAEWNGKELTLVLDHIDGKANNWKLNNLRLVCPNCDSQLSTFKGRNKGKSSRKFNVKMYQSGILHKSP